VGDCLEKDYGRRASVYEWTIGIIGLSVSLFYLPGVFSGHLILFAVLCALAVLLEILPVPLGKTLSSLTVALPIGTMVVYGSSISVWIMVVASVLSPLIMRWQSKVSVSAFNVGQYALSTLAMTTVFHFFRQSELTVQTILAVIFGAVVYLVVNHVFINVHQYMRHQFDLMEGLRVAGSDFIYLIFGFPFAGLFMVLAPGHPYLSPLVILPILIVGQSLRVNRKMHAAQSVHVATSELASEFDVDRLSERVGQLALKQTYADSVAILVYEEQRQVLVPTYKYPLSNISDHDIHGLEESQGGVIWSVIRHTTCEYVPDTLKDSRVIWRGQESSNKPIYRSMAIFPMLSHGEVQGAIVCYSFRPYAFSTLTEDMVTLASQVSVLLENAQLYNLLREQSLRDGATALYNYRFFYEALSHRVRQVEVTGEPLSIVVIDVDYFKKFNDTYGHLAGDEVLKSLATLFMGHVGNDSVVARYGGEEFSMILPLEPSKAYELIERIRVEVSHHVVDYEGYRLQGITISTGIASFPEHGSNDRDLLLKADSAMYWGAKQRGRNRTALYTPEFDGELFIDEVTGLYTYHFMNIRLRQDFLRGISRWGVLCIDIDHFNYVNNAFGFDSGDKVLKEISTIIKECLRQTELACRHGGDEFLILLGEVSVDEMTLVGERIIRAISTHRFAGSSHVTLSLRARYNVSEFVDVSDTVDLFNRISLMFASLHQSADASLA